MKAWGEDYQRNIFRYYNGQEAVEVDPLRLRGDLHVEATQRGVSIDKMLDTIEKGSLPEATDADQMEKWSAVQMLVSIVAKVFGIQYDPPPVDFALGLLNHFYTFLTEKKNPLVWHSTFTQLSESTSETQPTTATSSV